MYERAFVANPADARVFYEWDQLKKRAGLTSPADRLRTLSENLHLVNERDDLSIEFITLLNHCGRWSKALEQLCARQFSPWEGGEGLVSAQYVRAHRELGREALAAGNFREAMEHFDAARHYPHNLGEGKHLLTLERDLDYFSGLAALQLGDRELARSYWSAASAPLPALGIQSYFQALALREMGNNDAARTILLELGEFAAKQMDAEPGIDYFATSLPNMLLFDDDLRKRNRIESLLLSALAKNGLGDSEDSVRLLQQVLDADSSHSFATDMLGWFKQRNHAALDQTEKRAAQ
jgi:tetratricopeptide (TPR) repeat protein